MRKVLLLGFALGLCASRAMAQPAPLADGTIYAPFNMKCVSGCGAGTGGTSSTTTPGTNATTGIQPVQNPDGTPINGTDGAGTNPGTGTRGWLSGIFSKLPVVPSVAGTDASANPIALLSNLIRTCTLTQAGSYYFMNSSTLTIQVVFDDGNGGTVTIMPLAPGASAGSQGGDTSPPMSWFLGRIRIYASLSTAFVPGRVVGTCS